MLFDLAKLGADCRTQHMMRKRGRREVHEILTLVGVENAYFWIKVESYSTCTQAAESG